MKLTNQSRLKNKKKKEKGRYLKRLMGQHHGPTFALQAFQKQGGRWEAENLCSKKKTICYIQWNPQKAMSRFYRNSAGQWHNIFEELKETKNPIKTSIPRKAGFRIKGKIESFFFFPYIFQQVENKGVHLHSISLARNVNGTSLS